MNRNPNSGRTIAIAAGAAVILAAMIGTGYWLTRSYFAAPRQAVVLQNPPALAAEGDLTGQVVDAKEQPISGAHVGTTNNNGTRTPAVRTDTAGRFVMRYPREDVTNLFVTARGFSPAMLTVTLPPTSPVTVTLSPGRTITGRVIDRGGQPLSGATVLLGHWRQMPNPGYLTVKSAADGTYTFPDLPAGSFELLARQTDYNNASFQVQPDTAAADFKLQPILTIDGHVTDAKTHLPIAAFTVTTGVRWSANDAPSFISSFTKQTFNGGHYRQVLGGYGGTADAWFVRIDAAGYQPAISPPLNDSGTQDFELKPGENLIGKVTSPTGSPVAGAYVVIIHENEEASMQDGKFDNTQPNKVSTDATGHFQFPPQLGRYMLVAMADEGYAQVERTADGKSNEPVAMQLAAWGKINGTLLVGTHPAAKETIQVSVANPTKDPSRPHVFHDYYTHTDADGKFSVERIPPGNARICRGIVEWLSNGMALEHQTQSQVITITAGQTLSVNLGGVGRPVIGRVVPYAGMPSSEKLRLDNITEPRTAAETATRDRRRYSTIIAADGKFRLEDMPAGDYRMTVSAYPVGGGLLSLGGGEISFTVPEIPGGRSDEPLDIGDVPSTKPQ